MKHLPWNKQYVLGKHLKPVITMFNTIIRITTFKQHPAYINKLKTTMLVKSTVQTTIVFYFFSGFLTLECLV